MTVRGGKTFFICQNCGHQVSKWMGRCPQCHAWNSLAEELAPAVSPGAEVIPPPRGQPQPLVHLQARTEIRRSSGLAEFDRVLGGSLVQGSVVLVGGDPGIGKSTLILQVLDRL
ncbi:MAG: DNA repair protein RadA, partial [Deltaproteobacteria bacterium]|nr:DNA repair protein RadA [Deltaproteobacteria bacterium]